LRCHVDGEKSVSLITRFHFLNVTFLSFMLTVNTVEDLTRYSNLLSKLCSVASERILNIELLFILIKEI
jgi:hypothetical protein